MRFQHVCVEAFACTLPPHIVTSEEIEERLAPVYERLHLPAGRLEMMTGIRERRFFDPGTLPGTISATTATRAVEQSGIDRSHFGALVHASVCRDQMEPATACGVHHRAGLPSDCSVFDLSNACLGLLNGMLLIASMIELGQIRAGVVVGTEIGRPLVEGTIDRLLADDSITRKEIKNEFASLTIGSGSAAIVLCDRGLSKTGTRLIGGTLRADTSSHELCAGGTENTDGDNRPRMNTDSEALLHAGVALARETWQATRNVLGWQNEDVDKVFTHQVGKAHRRLLLEQLQLREDLDFPTVEFLGNTGAVALPMAAALGIEQGHLKPDDRVALLGIGSGLNSVMLGLHWQPTV
ncbi:3-oxoacyl-ACP synthase III [Maioricimonas sp. JC845]|uniref:3-oxoacyl-ACP synthase III n=1 Tax=Maioricimonas sp. JC845 TaxID=3232138 RepID=UPI00345AB9BB